MYFGFVVDSEDAGDMFMQCYRVGWRFNACVGGFEVILVVVK